MPPICDGWLFNYSSARDSLDSHLLAFAAEESRINKKVINLNEYKKS